MRTKGASNEYPQHIFSWRNNALSGPIHVCVLYMGRTLWKHVLGHMRTVNAQIRLHICAVWSGSSLSPNRIIENYRISQWRAPDVTEHMHDDLNLRMLCMFEGTFSLDLTHIYNEYGTTDTLFIYLWWWQFCCNHKNIISIKNMVKYFFFFNFLMHAVIYVIKCLFLFVHLYV